MLGVLLSGLSRCGCICEFSYYRDQSFRGSKWGKQMPRAMGFLFVADLVIRGVDTCKWQMVYTYIIVHVMRIPPAYHNEWMDCWIYRIWLPPQREIAHNFPLQHRPQLTQLIVIIMVCYLPNINMFSCKYLYVHDSTRALLNMYSI